MVCKGKDRGWGEAEAWMGGAPARTVIIMAAPRHTGSQNLAQRLHGGILESGVIDLERESWSAQLESPGAAR